MTPNPILSEEMVEEAARALQAKEWEPSHGCAPAYEDDTPGYWRESARAALEAVLPEVVEECAKVAEFSLMREPGGWPLRDPTPKEIAAAIRSLSQKDGK